MTNSRTNQKFLSSVIFFINRKNNLKSNHINTLIFHWSSFNVLIWWKQFFCLWIAFDFYKINYISKFYLYIDILCTTRYQNKAIGSLHSFHQNSSFIVTLLTSHKRRKKNRKNNFQDIFSDRITPKMLQMTFLLLSHLCISLYFIANMNSKRWLKIYSEFLCNWITPILWTMKTTPKCNVYKPQRLAFEKFHFVINHITAKSLNLH